MASVTLTDLVKIYPPSDKNPGFHAVKCINLEVKQGEFMVLVGPSGCGKSTTLRMIAGLEDISSGEIRIGNRVVNDVPPKDRDIAMVFQNYALYPHMSVWENMAFGLKLQKRPREEIAKRVSAAAEILGIESMLDRKPKALSGGQRQRVAVGRAIVRDPKVFLFDEPLSNLDAKMRVSMRTEISKLHARLGATMIYVTHDQVEAMTMGTRICVMNGGIIMQVDEPLRIYDNPANMFVAGFIGSPPMNFFKGVVQQQDGRFFFIETSSTGQGFKVPLAKRLTSAAVKYAGREIVFGIRPENIADATHSSAASSLPTVQAMVEVAEPMGAETFIYLNTGHHNFIAKVASGARYKIGETMHIAFDLSKAHLFDPQTEQVVSDPTA